MNVPGWPTLVSYEVVNKMDASVVGSFVEMSFKEILCFSHTHQLCIFKGLQHGRRREKSHDKLVSKTKP